MKQCPACKTTYTDETLRFCLADGGTLISLPDEEETLIRGDRRDIRVNVSPDAGDVQKGRRIAGVWPGSASCRSVSHGKHTQDKVIVLEKACPRYLHGVTGVRE